MQMHPRATGLFEAAQRKIRHKDTDNFLSRQVLSG
jgi:hypothetical protein